MNKRVKIVHSSDLEDLERDINDCLKKAHSPLVDIKISSAEDFAWSLLIFEEPKKKDKNA